MNKIFPIESLTSHKLRIQMLYLLSQALSNG